VPAAKPFIAACVQVTSGREIAANVARAGRLVKQARAAGADFILLPEIVNIMEPKGSLLVEKLARSKDGGLKAFRALAAETGAWLLAGSLVVAGAAKGKLANRSFLIDPKGRIKARYDKIHMFDVELAGGESYRESKTYAPGKKAVTARLPWGRLGMTVCYDMRFPHLYRALAQAGADYISVPSAFTRPTGRAHWHVLLRARAIETGCFVFAPAQTGEHEGGRKTFGHSLIVDPWGEVLADGGEEEGFVAARIDPARVIEARKQIPSLRHDRRFKV
jgi:predicted amidohydrolase